MIYNEIATVLSNHQIADNIYQANLYSPKISKKSKPGQFVNILPNKNWINVMRRPMSIASQKDNEISIIYKVFGEGTEIVSQWKENDKIDIIGPLGNFWKDFNNSFPILIGGGVGIAPIINLHHMLLEVNVKHSLIMGARKKEEHFIDHSPNNNIFLSTDLDDYGIKGNVIVALEKILESKNIENYKIFTCGPPAMMKAIAEYCILHAINCDLALETIMACGIGICQGCTVTLNNDINSDSYREKYALACLDGPIFNVKDIDNVCFNH